MQWFEYYVMQCEKDGEPVLTKKRIACNEENAKLVLQEAYQQDYDVIDDEETEEESLYIQPLPIESGGTGSTSAYEALVKLGAAPSGYGLGSIANMVSGISVDGTEKFGLYSVNRKENNVPFYPGFLIPMKGSFAGSGVQLCQVNIGMNGCVARRYKKNYTGEWSEWEYENPPMEVGTVDNLIKYRTTQRFLGKPVYTTIIPFVFGEDQKITISGFKGRVLNYHGFVKNHNTAICNSKALPYLTSTFNPQGSVWVQMVTQAVSGDLDFYIHGEDDDGTVSTDEGFVQIWYIKDFDET